MAGFIFSADWHLKPNIWKSHTELRHDTYLGAIQAVYHCINREADLILGGDQFDVPNPPAEAVRFLEDVVKLLNSYGLSVYAIQGNHDYSGNTNWLDVCGITSLSLEDSKYISYVSEKNKLQLRVFGTDYVPSGQAFSQKVSQSQSQQARSNNDQGLEVVNVMVCHQLIDSICPFEESCNLSESDIPADYGLVLLGDYHICTSTKADDRPSPGLIAYPGPVASMKLPEGAHRKAVYHVDPSNGVEGLLDKIELSARSIATYKTHQECVISEDGDLSKFRAFCKDFKSSSEVDISWCEELLELSWFKDNLNCRFIRTVLEHEQAYRDLSSPIIQVKFDPYITSKANLEMIVSESGLECYFWPVADHSRFIAQPEQESENEESSAHSEDLSYEVLLPKVARKVAKEESLSEDSVEFVSDLSLTEDSNSRETKLKRWRTKYKLDN